MSRASREHQSARLTSQRRALCQNLELLRVASKPRAPALEIGAVGLRNKLDPAGATYWGLGGLRGPPQLDVGRVSNFPPAHPADRAITAHAAFWSAPRDQPREPGRAGQSCPPRRCDARQNEPSRNVRRLHDTSDAPPEDGLGGASASAAPKIRRQPPRPGRLLGQVEGPAEPSPDRPANSRGDVQPGEAGRLSEPLISSARFGLAAVVGLPPQFESPPQRRQEAGLSESVLCVCHGVDVCWRPAALSCSAVGR